MAGAVFPLISWRSHACQLATQVDNAVGVPNDGDRQEVEAGFIRPPAYNGVDKRLVSEELRKRRCKASLFQYIDVGLLR